MVLHPPLHGTPLVLGTLYLSLETFVSALHSSITNVSLPAIAGDLRVSPSQGTWVINNVGTANAVSVPLDGWLTRRFGAVLSLSMTVLLFVWMSAQVSTACSMRMLMNIGMRQRLVAELIISLPLSLLLSSYPAANAGTALGLWSLIILIALVAGPLLGSCLTERMAALEAAGMTGDKALAKVDQKISQKAYSGAADGFLLCTSVLLLGLLALPWLTRRPRKASHPNSTGEGRRAHGGAPLSCPGHV